MSFKNVEHLTNVLGILQVASIAEVLPELGNEFKRNVLKHFIIFVKEQLVVLQKRSQGVSHSVVTTAMVRLVYCSLCVNLWLMQAMP